MDTDPLATFEAPYIAILKECGKAMGYGRSIQILEIAWDNMMEAQGLPPRFRVPAQDEDGETT